MMEDRALCTEDLRARVMKLWAPPAYYVLNEVRNGTGYGRREGYVDVLAMSVWPSRGLELIGAELKVSRTDWLRELKDPEKAEKFVKYCHRWYLITANDAAKEQEIPPTWGWMVAGPKGLKTIKAAPELKPDLPDWLLLASIFRNIAAPLQGMVSEREVDNLVRQKALAEAADTQRTLDEMGKRANEARQDYERLADCVRNFSCASGVDLGTWRIKEEDFRKEGALYHEFKERAKRPFLKELHDAKQRFEHLAGYIERTIATVKEPAGIGAEFDI